MQLFNSLWFTLPRVLSSLLVSSWRLSSCWSGCPVYHTDIFLYLLHRECQWQHCPHHVYCCGSTRRSGTGSTRGSGTQAQPKWTHRVSGFSWHCPPLDKIQCHKTWDLGMSILEVTLRDQVIQSGIVVGLVFSKTNFNQWGIEVKTSISILLFPSSERLLCSVMLLNSLS